jgi:hypothetical protein
MSLSAPAGVECMEQKWSDRDLVMKQKNLSMTSHHLPPIPATAPSYLYLSQLSTYFGHPLAKILSPVSVLN